MSDPCVIDFDTCLFDTKNVVLSDIKRDTNGRQSLFINYVNPTTGKKNNIYVKTPLMRVPFGFSTMKFKDKQTQKDVTTYSLNPSFDGYDDLNSPIGKFYQCLNDIDTLVKNTAIENFVSWFPTMETKLKTSKMDAEKAQQTRETSIMTSFTPKIKEAKTGTDFAPMWNMRLTKNKLNEFTVECFDE